MPYYYRPPQRVTAPAAPTPETASGTRADQAPPGAPDPALTAEYQEYTTASASASLPPDFGPPPLGFPMPNLPLKLVLSDEYGKLYADPRGFMWRDPSYRARYDSLAIADPTFTGGWSRVSTWFRSRKANPEYEPSASDQIFGGAAASSVKTVGLFALALGGLYVAAPALRKMGSR